MKALTMLLCSLCFLSCFAMILPESRIPVKTDDNMLTGFVRIDPDDKQPETESTRVWLWQDASDLIVHFEAESNTGFSKGSLTVRDDGTSSDYLRVQLITIPDAYYAYYYVAYPLGNLQDGVRNTSMDVDYSWNSHYSYSSDFDDNIWRVTMRIPLDELRFAQQQPYHWKIILTRFINSTQEYYSFPYANTNMGKNYFLDAQDIILETPVKHKLDVSLRPYLVKSYDLIAKTSSFDPEHLGLDLALSPGQRTRIKISLNPDFSDIPMDSAQDYYNSKYPPYYDENRFFFTEDIDAFGVDYDLFYSRNIVQPRLAFKATGNTKDLNWGVLGAFDKEIRDGDDIINPGDYYQVLALNPNLRHFQSYNSLTSRMNRGYYNHVFSNSSQWEFLPHIYAVAAVNLSTRKHTDEGMTEPEQGYRLGCSIKADPGNYDASLGYYRMSKDLAYDAGYLYETDFDRLGGALNWSKSYTHPLVRYLSYGLWGNSYRFNITSDPYQLYDAGFSANMNLTSRLNFLINGNYARDVDLNNDLHDTYNAMVGCTWNKLRNFRIFGGYSRGETLVYALSKVYSIQRINSNSWWGIQQNLSFSFVGSWMKYGYPEDNLINGIPLHLDNNYMVINAAVEYTPQTTFKITLGSGLSTYESANQRADLGYYGNLRYEFKPEWFLYLGFKSSQVQVEPSTYSDPLGHFRKKLASAYAKVSVTI